MRIKSFLLAGTVIPMLAIASLPAGADPRAFMLAQAQPVVVPAKPDAAQVKPGDVQATPEAKEEERKRWERRNKQKADRPDSAQVKPDAAATPPDASAQDRRRGDSRKKQEAQVPAVPPAGATTAAPAPTPPPTPPVAPAAKAETAPLAAPTTTPPPVAPVAPGTRQAVTPSPAPAAAAPTAAAPTPPAPVNRQAFGARPSPTPAPAAPPAPAAQTEAKPSAAPPPAITAATAPPPAAAEERRARRLDDVRGSRTQTQDGNRTVIREGGRTIIREGDRSIIRSNENDRFRAGSRDVTTQTRGAETVTTAVRPDGTRVVTVLDNSGRLQQRSRFDSGGREIIIIDNRRAPAPELRPYVNLPPPRLRIPRNRYVVAAGIASPALIYETLRAPPVDVIDRAYGLDEIRYSAGIRDRMRRIDIDSITFDTGSWEVTADQSAKLKSIADGMLRAIRARPAEVFLVEGHTDAVGSDVDNLSLSDRRAEAIAVALTDGFGVPPENLTTQGYGEEFLKIPTQGPERQNRRVAIRRITPLLNGNDPPSVATR